MVPRPGGDVHEAPVRVSVVIPTTGRPSLSRAVASVLNQTHPPVEVLVVLDSGPYTVPVLPLAEDQRVRVLYNGGANRGASASRQLGVEAAGGDLVALLDDDDWFEPDKLAVQVAEYRRLATQSEHVIVACRVLHRRQDGTLLAAAPRKVLQPRRSVGDYLFTQRGLRPGATALSSSMLLFDRALGLLLPFDSALPIHEEWDWLLRASKRPDVILSMVPEFLLNWTRQPAGQSLSSSASPWQSLAWALSCGPLTRRERSNCCLFITAPHALRVHNYRAFTAAVTCALIIGEATVSAWMFVTLYTAISALKRLGQTVGGQYREAPVAGEQTPVKI